MRKAPHGAGPKAATTKSNKQFKRGIPVLQVSPDIDEMPHIRSLPSTDRQDVVDLWWNLRLQGVRLHPQEHVIVLRGWRP